MPVTTRSQSRAKAQPSQTISVYNEKKEKFINTMKNLFEEWSSATLTKNKIIAATKVFNTINSEYTYLYYNCNVYDPNPNIWDNFSISIYNKIKELRLEHIFANGWPNIKPSIVSNLMNQLRICEKFINPIILELRPETLPSDKYKTSLLSAQAELKCPSAPMSSAPMSSAPMSSAPMSSSPKQRTSPRKNIKRIDYSQFY